MGSVKYDTLAVFVGPDNVSGNLASGDIKQLTRVQSTNYAIELSRENTMGLGTAFANDNLIQAPIVNLSVDYLLSNGQNEKNIGLIVDGTHGSLMNQYSGERDYFLLIQKVNETPMVLGIGNCVLMKYSVNATINDFVKASIDLRGHNIQLDPYTSGNFIPSVDINGLQNTNYTYQLPPVLQDTDARTVGNISDNVFIGQKDLVINIPTNSAFGTALSGDKGSYLQSFTFDLNLNRHEITQLGDKYPFKRCLELPTDLTLTANIVLSNFVADKIQNYFCNADEDIEIDIKDSNCTTTNKFWETESDTIRMKYIFRGMKLKSFQSQDSIGERKTVTLSWSVPIGNILDISRNLYISGDFGRYLFPVDTYRTVSNQPTVTGQGLRSAIWETRYRRAKPDVEYPEFRLEFSGNHHMDKNDPPYFVYYQGESGFAQSGSGAIGQSLIKTNYVWNSDSFSTVIDGLPPSGYTQRWDTFLPSYPVGSPTNFDSKSGEYAFYGKGFGFQTEPIEIFFANLPTWLNAYVETPKFQIDPYQPFYYDKISLGINSFEVPTGFKFDINVIAKTSKFKKIYTLGCMTPYSFNVTLTSALKQKTSLFLQPYDETAVTKDANNNILSLSGQSFNGYIFSGVSGSGSNPFLVYTGQNGKSYMNFDSGSFLQFSDGMIQDFRNFTFFGVYRPNLTSESGAVLMRFYQRDTGVLNSANAVFIGRRGLTQDLTFQYTIGAGFSGSSGTNLTPLQCTSCFDTVNWNLTTIVYDGSVASGRRNGSVVNTAFFSIPTSGGFSNVEVGSLDYHGDVAELILFPYKLSPTEIVQVETYLKYKWGI